MENIVADALSAAGHQITSFESVKDSEVGIRAQLVGWIEDPDIDMVLVLGEGENTSRAMAPLVDQPLPGFADLLRMLAFQEIGASAMLSVAEAARCGTTFVFVLPSGEGAVRAAMEKLILPQLDPATTPRNLVGSLPRLREEGDVTRVDNASGALDSIPTEIPKEKTVAGVGAAMRLPAKRSKPATIERAKSRTGANVLVKTQVEDPTKPIELQKLEKQIELSRTDGEVADQEASETVDQTLPAMVPTLPPAKPEVKVPATIARVAVRPQTPPAGGPVVKPRQPIKAPMHLDDGKTAGPKFIDAITTVVPGPTRDEYEATTAVGRSPALANEAKTAIGRSPALDHEQKTAIARSPVDDPKAKPSAQQPIVGEPERKPFTRHPPTMVDEQPAGAGPARLTLDELAAAELEPPVLGLDDVEPVSASAIGLEELEAEPEPAPEPVNRTPVPTPAPVAIIPVAAPAATKAGPALAPVPVARKTPAAAKTPPAAAVEPPARGETVRTAAVPAPIQNEPTEPVRARPKTPPPVVRAQSDLPVGSFNYPTLERSRVPIVLAIIAAIGFIAIGAYMVINRDRGTPKDVVAHAPADAAAVVEIDVADAAESIDAAALATDAEIEMPVEPRVDAGRSPRVLDAREAIVRAPRDASSVTPVIDAAVVVAVDAAPVVADGCDETTCVLEKYAKPCCARYKPTAVPVPITGSNENLEKPQIKVGVERVKPAVIACGEKFKVKGTVKVSVSVDGEGVVQSVDVQVTPDDALGKCVAAAVRAARFAKTTNGGSFSYPFVF